MKRLLVIIEKLRYHGFWLKDRLQGSKIKQHLDDIAQMLENGASSEAKGKREAYLTSLLEHAKRSTPFYKTLAPEASLKDFPVINKHIIQKRIEDFQSREWRNKKTKMATTSGSTGTILRVRQNPNKVHRNTADTLYFSSKAGYKMGYQLLYLRHWNAYYKKSKLLYWLQNIKPIEVLKLKDSDIQTLVKHIQQDPSHKSWLGYASGFESICKTLDTLRFKPINGNIKSIIAISEGLDEHTKKRMAYYFNAPVVSRYSNMENGIIAQQEPNNTLEFTINWASYHLEILQWENDVPAPSGTLGRIVITDLFNYSMPLIRYDTGDIGAIDFEVSPPVLKQVEGRKNDVIFNTNGEPISSFIMINNYLYEGIKQSQLIQEGKTDYLLKLQVSDNFHQEQDFIALYQGFLGKDANIKVQYVDALPLLSSGKRKTTINNDLP